MKTKIILTKNLLNGIFNMKFQKGAIDLEIDDTKAPVMELKFKKPTPKSVTIDFSNSIAKRQWFGLFAQAANDADMHAQDVDFAIKNDFAKLFKYYEEEFKSKGIKLPRYESVENTPKAKTVKTDKNKRFYINFEGKFYEKLNAKQIILDGYEEFEFFVHREYDADEAKAPVHDGNYWVVTEAITGMKIADRQEAKQLAIDAAKEQLQKVGKQKLIDVIEIKIKAKEISPRFANSPLPSFKNETSTAKAKALALEIELELLAA